MENTYQKECGADAIQTESGCEYVLADYQGDIKRILSAEARAIPSGRFVGDTALELAGIVAYDVLYVDGEGRLTNASFTSDYELSVPISENASIEAGTRTQVQNLSLRLSGPRKMTAKCMLLTHADIRQTVTEAAGGTAFSSEETPQVLERTLSVRKCAFGNGEEREYAEEVFHSDGVSAEALEVIATSGEISVERAESIDGGVRLGGRILLHAILREDGQAPFSLSREIPFEETVSISAATEKDAARGRGCLTSVSAAVRTEGEGVSLTLSCVAEFSAEAEHNEPLTVVTDAYLKGAESTACYRELCYEELAAQVNECFTASGSYTPKEEETPLHEILHTRAEVRIGEKEASGSALTVRGECTLAAVGVSCDTEGALSYGEARMTLPLEGKLRLPCSVGEGARVDCELTPCDIVCRLNGDTLVGECRFVCQATVTETKKITILDNLEIGAAYETQNDGTVVTVCYPSSEDTIWSVAKRYHTTARQIAVDNALTEEVMAHMGESGYLGGVGKLFV